MSSVVVLDDETVAKLDHLAGLMSVDRVSYLRWVLTGKTPTVEEAAKS